jgi:hypothetical protein
MADIVASGVRVFRYEKVLARQDDQRRLHGLFGRFREHRHSQLQQNDELNAVLHSERLAQELGGDFERDLAGCSAVGVARRTGRRHIRCSPSRAVFR